MDKLSFETLRCEMTISELNVLRLGPEKNVLEDESSSEEEHGNQEPPAVLHKDDEIEFYRSIIGLPNAEAENPEEDEEALTLNAVGLDKKHVEIDGDKADPEWLQRVDQNNSYLKDYERELRRELA